MNAERLLGISAAGCIYSHPESIRSFERWGSFVRDHRELMADA